MTFLFISVYLFLNQDDFIRRKTLRELSLLERIQRQFHQMSKMEKRIAKYFLDNYSSNRIILSTITEFARQVGVSESGVVRFCQRIGYSGFLELKNAWQKLLLKRSTENLAHETKEAIDTLEEVKDALPETIESDIRLLKEAGSTISQEEFQRAVELICEAKCVYIIGLSIKAVLAEFLYFRLRRYRMNVKLVTSGGNGIFEELSFLNEKDAVVLFDFHRIHEESLVALRFAKDKGARIIAITDGSMSQIALKADVMIMVGRGIVKYLNSLAAPVMVVQALSLGIAKSKKSCIPYLEEFDAIREKYSPFWHD